MPRDPRSPVLNVHRRRRSRNASSLSASPSPSNRPPSVGAPGASVSSVAASVGAASLSPGGAAALSPDDAARLSSSYTSGKARHYASQGADATVNSSNAPGTEERWLLDSADQLARWAAGVEQEQHTRRERWQQVQGGDWLAQKKVLDSKARKKERAAARRREPYLPAASSRSLIDFVPRIERENRRPQTKPNPSDSGDEDEAPAPAPTPGRRRVRRIYYETDSEEEEEEDGTFRMRRCASTARCAA